ncbi:MAG: MBL fold metallo-hydrolase [Candidatus Komeilibacteria bacterium]
MLKYQDLTIEKFNHDTILVQNDQVIYFDPFQIDMINMPRADVVFISHQHYDHCSPEDLEKVIKNDTLIVAATPCQGQLAKFQQNKIWFSPGERKNIGEIEVVAWPAYNINKWRAPGQAFHQVNDGGVGWVVTIGGVRLYFAGDTDFIEEMKELKDIDIAFLPISGTYVMTVAEAKQAIEAINPQLVVPMHYGAIIGDKSQAKELQQGLPEGQVKILG